jgi:hypothetical protein
MSEGAPNFPARPGIYQRVNTPNRAARARLIIASAAALTVAALVGATVAWSHSGHHAAAANSAVASIPEHGSADPGSTAGPLTEPPVIASPKLPAPVSSTPGPTSTPASTAPPRAAFMDVRLALPSGWRLIKVDGRQPRWAGCVLAPGQPKTARADFCALEVREVSGNPAGSLFTDPDEVGGFRSGGFGTCPDGSKWLDERAPKAWTSTVDGRHADVRTIVWDCAGQDVSIMQWAMTDQPNVVLTSYLPVGSPLAAQVREIVAGADLPARTAGPRSDFGLIKVIRTDRNGTILTLDRMIHSNPYDEYDPPYPADVNENPKTYDLRVAPNAVIRSVLNLCDERDGVLSTDRSDALGNKPCSLVDFATKGQSGATVWLTYDVHGKVNGIAEEFRS